MRSVTDYIDLKSTVTSRAVLGDFEITKFHVGKLLMGPGEVDTVYTYTPVSGIALYNTIPAGITGAYHHFEEADNDEAEELFYSGEVSIIPPETVDGKELLDIEAEVIFTESALSSKVKGEKDRTETCISLKKSVEIDPSEISNLYYKVLFCKIKSAPIVIISKTPDIKDINDFFVKTEDDIYNSSIDSNVDVTITKHILDGKLTNIKPKSLDMTYRELSKCYSGDYILQKNGVRESVNAIGIYEKQSDNEYEVIYKRRDESIEFKLDGWSNKYIDDNHIKTNVYRISETIYDVEKGQQDQPKPDPNYTQKRITSREEDFCWDDMDKVPVILEDIIGTILFAGLPKEKYPISLHVSEEDPKENNVLIPFDVVNTYLLAFSGAFPMGDNETEASNIENNLSVFVEMYKTDNDFDPNPMWIIMSYIDPTDGSRITHKVLHDGGIIYHDQVTTRYTAFTSIDTHTISYQGNTFRFMNRNLTDISGKHVRGTVFTYESPEIEFSIEFAKDKKPEITQFGSAIFSKNAQYWMIRSEYGCIMPYYLPLNEEK